MTRFRHTTVTAAPAALLIGLMAVGPAIAQDAPPSPPEDRVAPRVAEPEERGSRAQRSLSLSDAVRRVQRETGGQVLGAERVQYDGREINRIKVLDKRGRIRSMDDDPQRALGGDRDPPPPPPRARDDNR